MITCVPLKKIDLLYTKYKCSRCGKNYRKCKEIFIKAIKNFLHFFIDNIETRLKLINIEDTKQINSADRRRRFFFFHKSSLHAVIKI